jgi:hypothetical protein
MGSPVHHGAFSPVPGAVAPDWRAERAHLQCFERLSANRFEEVNNYSGRMTRRKANMTAWRISQASGSHGIPAGFAATQPLRGTAQKMLSFIFRNH